ncbi:hypothetical protein ACFVVX_15495 [Kitasatospora sp. NPDC058170]|uniref:hypothetical protein n=1 Tax=Kitasatospora sp. NPDC058170 TaxID=3346364 RepID=UPI0036D81576
MAALRSTGADVRPDQAFEYDAHPGYPSPSSAAAASGAKIVTGPVSPAPDAPLVTGPAASARADVTVGTHPEHGITATNNTADPAAAKPLAAAGFYRVPGHPTLLSLTKQQANGPERAMDTVARLRAAGLSVAADLPYDPDRSPDTAADQFRTHLIKVTAPSRSRPLPAEDDPFATRIIPAPDLSPAGRTEPGTGQDPFATRLHPAPAASGSRMGALLNNRQNTLATIEEILTGLAQQLRDDPQALDPEQVSAVLESAQTTLGGVRKDLETISAASPARTRTAAPASQPPVEANLGARAKAARATSLQLGRVGAAQPVAAAAQPVDPRHAYSIHAR